MAKRIKIATGSGQKRKDKQPASSQPTLEEDLFQAPSEYQNFLQFLPRKVEPLKCMHDKLLVTTHLPSLLEKYRLTKFLCHRDNVYPRLVKMFYANLGAADDKVSCYVMFKHIIIDSDLLAKEFDMDATPSKLSAGSFPEYSKEKAIDMLFPFRTPRDVNKKTLITGLSPEDRILHFVICKVLFPRATNFTQITEDELFYMWAIKTQADFNFPYLIMKYIADCSYRKDIGFLPYGMILTPFFKKFKIKVNEET